MQNDKINNEQHERLCAFLFGELEGADRAAFAQELAASPELQAEQSRIEASMELVREFAPVAPVALSPGARAGLVAAAERTGGMPGSAPGPTLAWYRHPGLQVAAATMLAFVAFRALDERMLENSATGEFGRRGEVAVSDRDSVADEPKSGDFRPVVNVRQTGDTFVSKEDVLSYQDPDGNGSGAKGGFNYEEVDSTALARSDNREEFIFDSTRASESARPVDRFAPKAQREADLAAPLASGQDRVRELELEKAARSARKSDGSEIRGEMLFQPAPGAQAPKPEGSLAALESLGYTASKSETDVKAVTKNLYDGALSNTPTSGNPGGTFKGPGDSVPPVAGGGGGAHAPSAPGTAAGKPLAPSSPAADPSASPAPAESAPKLREGSIGGLAGAEKSGGSISLVEADEVQDLGATIGNKNAEFEESESVNGPFAEARAAWDRGNLDSEYDFAYAPLGDADEKLKAANSQLAAEVTAGLEIAVSETKDKLAKFEVDSRLRKEAALNGDGATIGESLALLNETLAGVEKASDESLGGRVGYLQDFDMERRKQASGVDYKLGVGGSPGAAYNPGTGSSDWFLGRGEGVWSDDGESLVDQLLPNTGWLVRQGDVEDGSGLDGLADRRPGGGSGGVTGPDSEATDDTLYVTFGMTSAGEEVAVNVPAARARLVELEGRFVADHVEELGYTGGDTEPLSDEDKTELGLLRGYFEHVEVSKEQAKQDRLLAEQLEIEAKLRRAIEVEREYLTIVQNCIPKPGEKPSAMYYRYWGDNGYEFPVNDNLSTFSIDVDTASYTLARRYLKDGYLPERAQIRTEEFVNYATPDLPAPTGGDVFGISMELAPSPFGPNAEAGGEHRLLRIGVRGMEVDMTERDPVALTFVVDVSGSMATGGRLELVKHSLRLLVGELSPTDSIALVTFNNTATRVLDMTSVGNGAAIERALYEMKTGGGTNAEGGLRLGYEEAVLAHTPGAQNRVVFLSDGVGNIGETDEQKLIADVKRARDKGIYLNTIGFGMTNHNDRFLEQLADGGDGLCNYVDSPDEAQRALVDNFTGAFQTIARDVKIQVEFDKSQVLSYRQLGYENRAIADVDFRNDAVDAGEVGAGQQVIALYEVVLRDLEPGNETPLFTTRVRYKAPYGKLLADTSGAAEQVGDEVTKPLFGKLLTEEEYLAQNPGALGQAVDPAERATEIESSFYWNQSSGLFDGASIGFQKSALSAQFAEFLRRSSHAKGDSLSLLRYKLEELARTTGDAEVIELSALVQLAQPQLEPALLAHNSLRRAADELQRFEYDCLRTSYVDGDQSEDWLVTTNATREHLRESLRIEVYGSWDLEAR